MVKSLIDRHAGQQVKLWVSDALYAALKARAVRHNTSVAEELRKAASAGLDPLNGIDTIRDLLIDLRQFEQLHMEPLAFIAAMDAAFNAENWQQQAWMLHEHQYGEDKEKATAPYQKYQRMLRERATQRLQRKLRDGNLSARDDDFEEDP
jgi:plasmid stability protein